MSLSPPDHHPPVDLSVVIPVFNEEPNILPLWKALRPVLDETGEQYEVIFVDDGSNDGSGAALDRLGGGEPGVRILHLDGNWGQSAAFAAGFQASRGDWIITLDADLQNDPRDIPELLSRRRDAEAICGVRISRHDSWVRRFSSRVGNDVRNWITRDHITDTGCSLKVLRGELARRIRLYRGLHRFLPTLMRMEGARVVELPVHHHPRHAGRSKYGIGNRMWTGLVDCLAVRWMASRRMPYRAAEAARTAPTAGGEPVVRGENELSGATRRDTK